MKDPTPDPRKEPRRRPTVFELDELGEAFARDAAPSAFEEPPRPEARPRDPRARTAPGATPQEEATRDPAARRAAEAVDELELAPVAPSETAPRRRLTFAKLFAVGLSGLAALGLSLALWAFLEDLYARTPVLGWVALVLAALTFVGLGGMALREWRAVGRLKAIEDLRRRADAAVAEDDRGTALAALEDLIDLYGARPETARGRKALAGHMKEIIDGRDLVALAEREVLSPLDAKATAIIVSTARRVAAVTALSPRALVDVAFVIFAALSMVRRIAEVYGGRPGTLGFWRVLRHAVAHLAVTGGMAAGDAFVGEVIGKGIAARLSARLGEGIVNGLMTARLGLAAMDVLRPLPFAGTRRPRVNDILGEIARIAPREER